MQRGEPTSDLLAQNLHVNQTPRWRGWECLLTFLGPVEAVGDGFAVCVLIIKK